MSSRDLVQKIPANVGNTKSYKLDVTSYAGRIDVGEHDARLFYWFFESRKQKGFKLDEIPLVLWLNGGLEALLSWVSCMKTGRYELKRIKMARSKNMKL